MNFRGIAGVYSITCTASGMVYIGSSNNIGGRLSFHCSMLRLKRHHSPQMQLDWDQYGKDCFVFEVLHVIEDKDERLACEAELIYEISKTGTCYNVKVISFPARIFTQQQFKALIALTSIRPDSKTCQAMERHLVIGFSKSTAAVMSGIKTQVLNSALLTANNAAARAREYVRIATAEGSFAEMSDQLAKPGAPGSLS